MTKTDRIEQTIIATLRFLGRATARQVESHPDVAQACREAKLKARHRLDMMTRAGKIKSDMAHQAPAYWV